MFLADFRSCYVLSLHSTGLSLCHIWNRTNAQYPHWRLSGTNIAAAPPAPRRRVQDLGDHAAHALEHLRTCLSLERFWKHLRTSAIAKKHQKKQCGNRRVRAYPDDPMQCADLGSVPQQPFLQVNGTAAIHVHAWWWFIMIHRIDVIHLSCVTNMVWKLKF